MGLKMHAVSLVASIVFHACVRSRTDWACCQSKKSWHDRLSPASCATLTKPVSKLFLELWKCRRFGMQNTGDTVRIILGSLGIIWRCI